MIGLPKDRRKTCPQNLNRPFPWLSAGRPHEAEGGPIGAVRASGPWAYQFQGTIEQNLIYHVMDHALTLHAALP